MPIVFILIRIFTEVSNTRTTTLDDYKVIVCARETQQHKPNITQSLSPRRCADKKHVKKVKHINDISRFRAKYNTKYWQTQYDVNLRKLSSLRQIDWYIRICSVWLWVMPCSVSHTSHNPLSAHKGWHTIFVFFSFFCRISIDKRTAAYICLITFDVDCTLLYSHTRAQWDFDSVFVKLVHATEIALI